MQRKLVEKLLLVVVMVVLCMAVDMTASALEPTGQCGDDVYWTFDETTGELVISGEGDMWDYRDPETASTKISPFENSQEIKSIIIEDGISSIGAKSFWGCQTLENVVIAESVTNIFDYAFAYCSNLVEFDFSNALKTLGEGSFHNCTNLNNVVLPESLTSIEPLVFQFCTSLESIIIPANVTNIYYCAFNGCVGLKTVILSKELTDIGESAFLSCASLEEIIVPGKVQNISDYAFSGCTSLEKVILPKSLNGLNVGTFNWCFSLNEVILPESIGEIKEYNFYNCISLKKAICENKELIFDGEEIYSIDLVLDENITISEFTEKSKAYICSMAKLDEVSNAYQNNSELVQKYEEEFNKAAIEMENCLTMLDEPRPIDDLILYGHTHSTTESYAIANNIPFTALEGSEHPDKYFATDWTYDYENMVRYRQCEFTNCDVRIEEALEEIKKDSDVEIVAPTDPDTDFEVDEIEKENNNYIIIEEALSNGVAGDFEIVKAFDINLKNKDGVHVQPDGTVKVKLPLDWSKDGVYKVYRVNDDGTLTDMNAYREGSHMVFDTDHFSIYVIVDESEKTDAPTTPDEPQEETKDNFFSKLVDFIKAFFDLIASLFKR